MKKRLIVLICIMGGIISIIGLYYVSNLIHKSIQEDKRIEKYEYSISIIANNIEQLENLCSYDLENCKNYNNSTISSSKEQYYVPQIGSYQKERDLIFHDIGLYNGFDYGLIDPNEGTIMFLDDSGSNIMRLIYYKNGNKEANSTHYKIGEHFTIDYSSIQYSE